MLTINIFYPFLSIIKVLILAIRSSSVLAYDTQVPTLNPFHMLEVIPNSIVLRLTGAHPRYKVLTLKLSLLVIKLLVSMFETLLFRLAIFWHIKCHYN